MFPSDVLEDRRLLDGMNSVEKDMAGCTEDLSSNIEERSIELGLVSRPRHEHGCFARTNDGMSQQRCTELICILHPYHFLDL
jgi:hypothetical protein